ncbi:hypothetical protein ACFPZL_11205 [Leucobacter soli]|uniref:5-methyltetrahydropteroyltriglutamate--homocysteine methyltransferase n=1 Tax=Leucobacter soli TaxID=2812850 RepID=A0A916NEN5_9MICO|nr:hypothetical protein [Leucobacter soli]CAG7598006.1 hypothetical protein LEUCIP111803_00186 [Leucobacter soli]
MTDTSEAPTSETRSNQTHATHAWGLLPTEPVGSMPRTLRLQQAVLQTEAWLLGADELAAEQEAAVRDTLDRLAETGSPIVSDGEQRRSSFATYPLGRGDAESGPVFAVFADGHHRVLPRLVRAPFRFQRWAADDVLAARRLTGLPLKQAVISPSMLSLMLPDEGIGEYTRDELLEDVVAGCAEDIARCFSAGAARVSIDFTEGRLALRRDLRAPWAGPAALRGFIELVNRVLDRVDPGLRDRIGVHTCPGNDRDSAHSDDVDYAALIPELLQIEAGYFLVQAASERDPLRVARLIGDELASRGSAGRLPRILIGVTDPRSPKLETAEEVRDGLLAAARFIPAERLGSTDDCGFSPYLVDEKPRHGSPDFARDVAFAKVAARVRGTALAAEALGAGS